MPGFWKHYPGPNDPDLTKRPRGCFLYIIFGLFALSVLTTFILPMLHHGPAQTNSVNAITPDNSANVDAEASAVVANAEEQAAQFR